MKRRGGLLRALVGLSSRMTEASDCVSLRGGAGKGERAMVDAGVVNMPIVTWPMLTWPILTWLGGQR